ncbi:MAG: HAD family hydrolase [Planctomycetota bacterium]
MLPKGILFDLDDTILAFGAAGDETWRSLCNEYAGRCALDAKQLLDAFREVADWYWSDEERHRHGRLNLNATRRRIVRLAFEKLGIANPALADEIADAFSVRRVEAIRFFPRAEETLRRLLEHGVAMALMTNGEAITQRAKVERFGLVRFFKTILIEGELGFGKPHPDVYRRALDDLGLDPRDVWSVGDNLRWDVAGPQALGVFGIWHDWRGEGLPPDTDIRPDRTIRSIAELIG